MERVDRTGTTLATRDENLPDAYSEALETLSLAPLWAALHMLLPNERHHAYRPAPLALDGSARAAARSGTAGRHRAGGAAGARPLQSRSPRRLRRHRNALRGPADHSARRERAEPSPHAGRAPAGGRGPRGVHDRGRGQVRDGARRSHHHAADAVARPRPRGHGAGDLARRPRHPARAERRRKLGLADEASGSAHDEHGLVRGRADGGWARASPLALRGHRLSQVRWPWRTTRKALAGMAETAPRQCPWSCGTSTRARATGRSGPWGPRRSGSDRGSERGRSGGRAAASFTRSRGAARA